MHQHHNIKTDIYSHSVDNFNFWRSSTNFPTYCPFDPLYVIKNVPTEIQNRFLQASSGHNSRQTLHFTQKKQETDLKQTAYYIYTLNLPVLSNRTFAFSGRMVLHPIFIICITYQIIKFKVSLRLGPGWRSKTFKTLSPKIIGRH